MTHHYLAAGCAAALAISCFAAGPQLPRGYEALDYIWATNAEQFVSTGIKAGPKEKFRVVLDRKVIPLVTNAADGVILSGKLPERTHLFKVVRLDEKIEKPKEKGKPSVTSIVEKVLAEYVPVRTDKGAAVFYDLVSKQTRDTAVKGAAFKPGYPDWQFVVDDVAGDWWMDGGEPICPPVVVRDKTTAEAIAGAEYRVAYSNNVECGKAYVFVTGTGAGVHTGVVTKTFTLQTTFAVGGAGDAVGGSFSLKGVSDRKTRGVEWSVATNVYEDCGARDFTFTLRCPREGRTPAFKAVNAADFTLPFAGDAEVAVWNGVGETFCDGENPSSNFTFRVTALKPGEKLALAARHGHPSSCAFPYFRVYDAKTGKGWTLALGYQGQWKISFARTAKGVRVLGGLKDADFYINRNESVIVPTVTLQAFDTLDGAVNNWRRFLRAHVLPRDRRTGGVIRPMLALDPHEKGELYTETTADRLVEIVKEVRAKGLCFDTLWIDAGWYTPSDFKRTTKAALWWESVGLWKPDPKRFPNGFRPVADELAKDDAVLTLWFEPERVHHALTNQVDVKRWCYNLETNGCWRYNFGSGDTVKYLSETIGGAIAENGVGVYREDCNMFPVDYWAKFDGKDRIGLCENFYVQGRRAYWANLKKRFPKMLFDTCAAGGRRLDLATLRAPSVPLHYSDVACEVADLPALQRCQHLLNQWFVYRKDIGSHRLGADGRRDWGRTATCLAPFMTVWSKRFLGDGAEEDAKAVAIWRQVAHLTIDGDYWLLTPEEFGADRWWACEFFDAAAGRGLVQAVRNAKAADATRALKLKGLRAGAAYDATDLVTGKKLAVGADGALEIGLEPGAGALVLVREIVAPKPAALLTSRSYAEGVYAQWDGIENAGRGKHDAAAKTWVNLVQPHKSISKWTPSPRDGGKPAETAFDANGFRFRRSNSVIFANDDLCSWYQGMEKQWTVEAFVTPAGGWWERHSSILGYHAGNCTAPAMGQYDWRDNKGWFWFALSRNARDGVGVSLPAAGFKAGLPVHVAMRCDAEAFTVWTNGVLAATAKVPKDLDTTMNAAPFRIGRCYDDTNRTFDGTIHAVRTYGRALKPEEIAANAATDRARFCGHHVVSPDASVTLEGAKDYVVRAMPVGAPAEPKETAVRVTLDWFPCAGAVEERPAFAAADPYVVTNEQEGIVWSCTGARTVSTERHATTLEFAFRPVAYRVKAVKPKGGEIEPAVGWAPADGAYAVTAKPAKGNAFYRWTKGVDTATIMKPTATVHAKGPQVVACEFESEEVSEEDFNF